MSLDNQVDLRVESILEKVKEGNRSTWADIGDLVRWGIYGSTVFSQFGLGLSGSVFRQQKASVKLTVKVVESGTPLVAFITAGTTMGSIESLWDLLYHDKLKWQKDRYPWV